MKEVNGYNPSKDQRLINCKTECGNNRCFAKRYGLFAKKTCPNFMEPKSQTNADRIRAMSDEELADYLRWHNDSYSRYGMDWLDWLKAPVEEVDE